MIDLALLALVLVGAGAAAAKGPIVKVRGGLIEGKIRNAATGAINAFYGVPFAAPPVGELRFSAPVNEAPWVGIKQATKVRHRTTITITAICDCTCVLSADGHVS